MVYTKYIDNIMFIYGAKTLDDVSGFTQSKNKVKVEKVCPNCGKAAYPDLNKFRQKCRENKLLCQKCACNQYDQSERVAHQKQTLLNKYGVDNVSKIPEVKEKKKQTCEQKYGSSYTFNAIKVKNKIKETLLNKYNTENLADISRAKKKKNHYDTFLNRCTKNNIDWLDKENYLGSSRTEEGKYIKFKFLCKTCGLEYLGSFSKGDITKCPKCFPSRHYFYDFCYFDSSWELAFYVWHKDNGYNILRNTKALIYSDEQGKQHKYYPDFIIDNQYIEIKGDHLLGTNGLSSKVYTNSADTEIKNKAKFQCMIQNNVKVYSYKDIKKYLDYMKNTYGKDWRYSLLLEKKITNLLNRS